VVAGCIRLETVLSIASLDKGGVHSLTPQICKTVANVRVLVVEDEYLIAEEISEALHAMSIDVVGPVGNLQEAHDAVQDTSLDCAVMDINIGGGASFPLIDTLLQRNVSILLMTGYDQEELPIKYRSLPLLQKPLLRGELAETLERLLSSDVC
jgi:DNA-binding response OmpR family regulator